MAFFHCIYTISVCSEKVLSVFMTLYKSLAFSVISFSV